VIEQLISECHMQLPSAFLELLRVSNGGFAELTASPWNVDFWAAETIMRLNHEYGVDRGASNFLAFGSNLGEELLAFDRREGASSGVYLLPWHAPDEADAMKVAKSFERLVETMKEQPGDES
jgi:hypothetical protein